MKLMITILRDSDSDPVSQALISAGFGVTRVATTGGVLRRGSSTLMIGLEEDKIDQAIAVIRAHTAPPVDPGVKRATVFVLNVEEFTQV